MNYVRCFLLDRVEGKAAVDRVDKFLALGRECCEFEPSSRRSTSPLSSLLLAAAPSRKLLFTFIFFTKEVKR